MMHRLLISDARQDLARVAHAQQEYLDTNPYRVIHGYDARGGLYTVRVEVTRSLPSPISEHAARVVQQLRSALDAIAATLATPGQLPSPATKPIRFPIHDSLPEFAQRSRGALATMTAEAQATIEALQPYHRLGGYRNDPLWLLRELAVAGVPTLAAGSLGAETAIGVNTCRHVDITGDLRVDGGPFAHGQVIASIAARVAGPDPKLDLFLRPQFQLAFTSGGPARGAPLVPTLGALCDRVEQIASTLLDIP
ncbi:MAG: hypothetical protein LH467_13055 [Gemmatimonadaceae bacterium]|nr:hypothetical protein [Gemmatimonadaceae bacterium]